ncbi:MAG: hypothetical protein KAR19_05120 [Bacteroidales bacterium]|nr:hypothetical protein [Bacteroidales bacterium]
MNRIIQAIFLISILASPAFSQEPDSIIVTHKSDSIIQFVDSDMRYADTLVVEQPDFSHSASKAIMYSLVLPGLGQGYNGKYFKIPIVYAALGVAGYAIVYNTKNYKQAILDYSLLQDTYNERVLQGWRRNMELSYIGLIVVYALQVVDAYVDAQLYSWEVNDNLSLRIAPSLQPMMIPASGSGQAYGLTCSFDLKGK